MSTLVVLALTAAVAVLVGAMIGARNARRKPRRDIPDGVGHLPQEYVRRTYGGADPHPYAPGFGAPRPAPSNDRRPRPSVRRPASHAPRTGAALATWGPGASGARMRRTPVLDEAPAAPKATAELRVSTAAGDTICALPDEESLTIGPPGADIVVPGLPTRLILGRSGYLWTVQVAGPVDLDVALDGVPLTSVPMPWSSERQLTAGALTLVLDKAPPAPPSFREPTATVDPRSRASCAARANAHGLVIGRSGNGDAATLVAAALAALDPRMLDPARTAALAALRITLSVRDAQDRPAEDIGGGPPDIAVLAIDEDGELRAAANFDVSAWAITENARMRLSGPLLEPVTPLDVVPLDLHAATPLGEHPMLLLTAGASATSLGRHLADCTAQTTSPERLVEVTIHSPQAMMAAAAVAAGPVVLPGGIPRARTRGVRPHPAA